MDAAHRIIGFAIVGGFFLLLAGGGVLWVRRRGGGRLFWGLLAGLQITLLVQLAAGLVLLAAGGRPPLLHYVYGIVFPVLVLAVAHLFARGMENPAGAPRIFTVASFFVFGLTLRALMTGLNGA